MQKLVLKPLKGYNSFTKVFKAGKKIKTVNALGVFCKNECTDLEIESNESTLIFGVTVSKKIAPKAVMRNRVKRLLRESIRKFFRNKDQKPEYNVLVISWRYIPEHSKLLHLSEVFPQVEQLLLKAENLYKKENTNA